MTTKVEEVTEASYRLPNEPSITCPQGRTVCIDCGAPDCDSKPKDRPPTGPADLISLGP